MMHGKNGGVCVCAVGCVVKGVVISILSVSRGKNISAAVTMAPEFVLG